jgi:hypothetical protein
MLGEFFYDYLGASARQLQKITISPLTYGRKKELDSDEEDFRETS